MKVMIIDDGGAVRRMITSFLDDLVDEFVECGDGAEALTAYIEHKQVTEGSGYEEQEIHGYVQEIRMAGRNCESCGP